MWKKYKKSLLKPESYVSMGLGFLVVLVIGILLFNFFTQQRRELASQTKDNANQISLISTTPEPTKSKGVQPSSAPTFIANKQGVNTIISADSHVVVSGESLWSISQKYFNTGFKWTSIAKENNLQNPGSIKVGQVLRIPKADSINNAGQISSGVHTERIIGTTYTVVKGDYLWDIAVRAYGDGFAWVKIAKINHLTNPNLIHSGNVFIIPR